MGSIACTYGGEIIRCKALDLNSTFVNDLGAGDTFAAFLIDSYLRQIGKIDRDTLAWATSGAAMVCQISDHMLSYIDMSTFREIFELVQRINNESSFS